MYTPERGRGRIRIRFLGNVASFSVVFVILTFCPPPGSVDAQSVPQTQTSSSSAPSPGAAGAVKQSDSHAPDKNSPEMASADVPTTFKVNVKLVVVRVVARDSQGHAIGNLQRQDFQVFDNGKPQTITQFSVEKAGARTTIEPNRVSPANEPAHEPGESVKAAVAPQRYTAYVFDDVHLKFGDLTFVRQAAERHLASLQPTDRAAIFSTSGQSVLDFTDDHAKLHDTLLTLQPHPIAGSGGANPCPDVSYYMADLIINKEDEQALQTATLDALHCAFADDPHAMLAAQNLAKETAMRSIDEGEQESRLALRGLKDMIRRIALMPGQRSIVFVSPGFQTPQIEHEYIDVIDRALHSEVIIGAIDARGLYLAGATSDSSKPGNGSNLDSAQEAREFSYATESAALDDLVLRVIADGTGGTFFHNSNDLYEGFTRVAAPPEYSYVLGFVPQNLKPDGSFHTLKVKLNGPLKLNLQARRGYYAARHLEDPAEETKREIEDAVFSQDDSHGLPVELRTQFYKPSDDDAKLLVLAKVDVKHIRFRKEEGRNRNDLTVVSALFDRNGNYLKGEEKVVQMRWKDETLESMPGSGVTVESRFDVKPGTYRVRLIVRDAEGQSMTAESSAVEIP
jgi:VWFA-related protein